MGKWTITKPKACTNLIANPSFEIGTSGWSSRGGSGTLTRTIAQQRRGAYSLSVTPASWAIDGVYTSAPISATSGASYYFSVDIMGAASIPYVVYIGASTGSNKGMAASFTATGNWQRQSASCVANATELLFLHAVKDSHNSIATFYIDGAMCASEPTSYFDGDTVGNVIGQSDFWWTGSPHTSTSVTSGQSTKAGIEVDLETAGYFESVQLVTGEGMPPQNNIILPNAIIDGAQYQTTLNDTRSVNLIGRIDGKGNLATLHANRARIETLLKPAVAYPQPIRLGYTGAGGKAYMDLVYAGGMEGNSSDGYSETVSLKFTATDPRVYADGGAAASLAYNASMASSINLLQRSPAGSWGEYIAAPANISAMCVDGNGALYFGGNFSSFGGVASTAYVAKYANGVVTSMGGSGMDGIVYSLVAGPDNTIYAGGKFTVAGGVASTRCVAKNVAGSAWSAMGGSGMTASDAINGGVRVMAMDSNGVLYAGGVFESAGGVASTAHIAKNVAGSAWSSMGGSGMTNLQVTPLSVVLSMTLGLDNALFVGGNFDAAGGVASTRGIAKYTSAAGFTSVGGSGVGGGSGSAASGSVYTLETGPDGLIYAGGQFPQIAGVASTANIAVYNRTAWISTGGSGSDVAVTRIFADPNGMIYAGGAFYNIGGVAASNSAVRMRTTWAPMEVTTYGEMIFGGFGALLANTTLSPVTGAVTTVTNAGAAPVVPVIKITGPGTLVSLRNFTAGTAIYFNLTLMAGEVVKLDLTPGNISFISTFRGNILSTILPGSNLANFKLMPGANFISLFIGGTPTAATAARLEYPLTHYAYDSVSV